MASQANASAESLLKKLVFFNVGREGRLVVRDTLQYANERFNRGDVDVVMMARTVVVFANTDISFDTRYDVRHCLNSTLFHHTCFYLPL